LRLPRLLYRKQMKNKANTIQHLSEMILKSIGVKRSDYQVHEPIISKSAETHILKCVKSNYVSSLGDYLDKFENKLKEITGSKYILLTNSGTAALFISLKQLKVEKSEVLMPSMTFAATSNAVIYNNAIPHYIDSMAKNPCLDIDKLAEYLSQTCAMKEGICYNKDSKRKIKTIIVVHPFGYTVDMNRLIKLCNKYNIKILEDAAGALGSYYKKKHVGTFADFGILSFNGNKIVTTGMGGAILMNNHKDYKVIKHLISTARLEHPYEISHDKVGYNLRMSNINAALGYAQLLSLKTTLRKKKKLYEKYSSNISKLELCDFIKEDDYSKQNNWVNNLVIKDEYIGMRSDIFKYLHSHGIKCRATWKPQHLLKMNLNYPRMKMDNCVKLWKSIISLPSSYI
jgi:perosamine synthetase